MSLSEPLNSAPPSVSDVEVGVPPQSKVSLLTRYGRSIIVSLSVFSSLSVAAFAVVLFLFLSSPPSTPPPHLDGESATPKIPFLTTGNPHPIGQPPPFVPRLSVLARLGQDMDFSRNLSVDPCEDFYQYSCGGWVAAQVLPAGTSSITKSFDTADAENLMYVKEVIEAGWPLVTPYYQACMNVDALDKLGFQPTQWFMEPLNPKRALLNKTEIFWWMGSLRQRMGLTSIFALIADANMTNPRQPMLYMIPGGTTFDNPYAYYGPYNITRQIADGITAMLTAAGDDPADAAVWAKRIVDFEVGFIEVLYNIRLQEEGRTYTEEEWGQKVLADDKKNLEASNNYYQLQELEALMPNTPIKSFFEGTQLPQVLANAGVVGYVQLYGVPNATFVKLDDYLKTVEPLTLQLYVRWHALNVSTPYLSESLQKLHLKHFDVVGVDQLPPRNDFCSYEVTTAMPDLFGRYFMARRLSPEMRDQARDMISWIKAAFEYNLPEVAWMDDTTRGLAAEKAYAVYELVGGPDSGNWSDYSEVLIRRDRYYENWLQIQGLRTFEDWVSLTAPISRGKWPSWADASQVNAFYSPNQNSMFFLAGILVDPFYNGDYPMAMNLGSIGMVMGHELLHGFDNNGRQFDKDGQLKQWWDDNVITAFGRKTKCLINQYNNIEVQGYRLNGQSTLGENIADNGGLHMSYLALQWYKQQLAYFGMEDPVPPSKSPLTTDQLFYWAHAQTWCTKATDLAIRRQIIVDAHSPGEARAWAPVVNQEGFAKAFNCPVGSRMNPPLDRKCDLY